MPLDGKKPSIVSDLAIVGAFTLLYVPYVAHAAVTRAFWLDELFTYYIVTMPDWGGMFDLIRRGPDQNPPLFYILTRLTVAVFGESEWAFRLPAMVGYWVFCAALYGWVRLLGGGRAAALVAMATPVFTGAVYYAGEARPYGPALGAVGFGLFCRRLAETTSWRRTALFGLAGGFSLAAALHYLALLPIGICWLLEALQSWRRRRIVWEVWGALLSPLCVLALHRPWLQTQAALPFWKTALHWEEVWMFYHRLLSPPQCLWLALTVGGAVVFAGRTSGARNGQADLQRKDCPWLTAGAAFALLLPVGWMVFLKLIGRTFFADRYVLAAAAGWALLAAYPLRCLPAHHERLVGLGVLLILALSGVTTIGRPWRLAPPSVAEVADLPNPAQPILVDVGQYLPLKHYLGDQLPQVTHVFGTMTYQQPTEPNRGLRALARHPRAPRFEEPEQFFPAHARCYIVCHKAYNAGKLIPELERRRTPVVRETAEYLVYDYDQRTERN